MTFRLIADVECNSGGICGSDGTPLKSVPDPRVIPGPITATYDETIYWAAASIPSEIGVRLSSVPLRRVRIPLTVTYGDGLTADDVSGIPASLEFSPGQTMNSFAVRPTGGEPGRIEIGFGDLPPGVGAGGISNVDVTINEREVWSSEMTVGSSEGYLGYSTFARSTEGSLTRDEFSWRGSMYTVTNIVLSPDDDSDSANVGLDISPGFLHDPETLCLILGDLGLNLSDGRVNDRQYYWQDVALDWEDNESVEVGLREFHPSFHVRSTDGRYNNSGHPHWGNTGAQLLRKATVSYMDRTSTALTWLPSARGISNTVMVQDRSVTNAAGASSMLWQWGQFLDHDIGQTPLGGHGESLPISVPSGDPIFDPGRTGRATLGFLRSEFDESTGTGPDNPREQINRLTAFIDASQVYGSDGLRARTLRANDGTGKLDTSADGRFLPYNVFGLDNDGGDDRRDLFLAGDVRANEQVGLSALHTLFVREHNRIAEELGDAYPGLRGDYIFEIARKIVGAQMQVITFNEFLPLLLGPDAINPYSGYDPEIDSTIDNEFSTAAFRVGHTMLPPSLLRVNARGREVDVSLTEAFFNPSMLVAEGISEFLRGLATQQAQEIDVMIVDEVRNLLFGGRGGPGMDLAALNIQRTRDHGIADYNSVRAAYGLAPVSTFSEMSSDPAVQRALMNAYGDVRNLELFVAGLAEDHAPGAMMGETYHAVISDQFQRLRNGDRFWYENDPYFLSRPELMEQVATTTLADVIRRNSSIENEIPDDVFTIAGVASQ